jgi:hypothetical protein
MGMTEVQVERAYDDIIRKQRTTNYLRMVPPELSAPEIIG